MSTSRVQRGADAVSLDPHLSLECLASGEVGQGVEVDNTFADSEDSPLS